MLATDLLLPAAVSFLFGIILAPLVIRLVTKIGVVDKPDGRRKLHGRTVPLAGGPLIILTLCSSLLMWYLINPTFAVEPPVGDNALDKHVGAMKISVPLFLLSILAMFAVGLIDDRLKIRGRVKLIGQVGAILIAISSGVQFNFITALGIRINFEPFGSLVTAIFLLGVVNAVNLLDGIDGMLGSIGLIVGATLAIMAAWAGRPVEAMMATCLTGALGAFLLFNKPPAKIFLGDSGSMTIGLLLGSLAVVCSFKGPATMMLSLPVALLLLPIMDTGAAIVRRVLTGRSIFATDRGHLHHRLLQSGLSHRVVLALVMILSAVLSMGVLTSVYLNNDKPALVSMAGVLSFLVLSRLFGVQELLLVRNKIQEMLSRFASARSDGKVVVIRLQGQKVGWEAIWQHLANRAEQFGLHSASVNINAPQFQESYYVRWASQITPVESDEVESDRWQLELPLKVDGQMIGVVKMAGPTSVGDLSLVLGRSNEFVRELAGLTKSVLVPGIHSTAEQAIPAALSLPSKSPILQREMVGV